MARPTAYAAIETLVARGDLVEITGKQRRRVYEAPRIYNAVYGPVDVPETDTAPITRLASELDR